MVQVVGILGMQRGKPRRKSLEPTKQQQQLAMPLMAALLPALHQRQLRQPRPLHQRHQSPHFPKEPPRHLTLQQVGHHQNGRKVRVCVRACVRATVTVKSSVKMHFQDPKKNPHEGSACLSKCNMCSPSFVPPAFVVDARIHILWPRRCDVHAFSEEPRASTDHPPSVLPRTHVRANATESPARMRPRKELDTYCTRVHVHVHSAFPYFFHTPSLPKPTIK